MNIALITGITGQDGSYLAERLLERGYTVYGLVRPSSSTVHLTAILTRLRLLHGDVLDGGSLHTAFQTIWMEQGVHFQRLEVYHLASQSSGKASHEMPEYTAQVDALGTLRILEAILKTGMHHKIRFFHASSAEVFGDRAEIPQTELTPFRPVSPAAAAKLYAHTIVHAYRENYRMFACNGILFHHSSPRAKPTSICQKIARAVTAWMTTGEGVLELGNLNARRDMGHALDMVDGMWMMLQTDEPRDYVLGTGEAYSVRELVEMAVRLFGKVVEWHGEGLEEIGTVDGRALVCVQANQFRPTEVEVLIADASRARQELGWAPRYTAPAVMAQMVAHVSARAVVV